MQKDCNNNVEWFKNIKNTHGDVEVNTLEELKLILSDGEFYIGSKKKEAFNLISDVISLQIKTQGTAKHYTLEQLQDLESRLVLFAGQRAEMSDVQKFLIVSV